MSFRVADIVDELKTLRRGYGIESPDLAGRVGSALRSVCGVLAEDPPATLRRKVADALAALTDRLPEDLGRMSRTALGFDGTAQERYQQRVKDLAVQLQRDPRTVQRRIDTALLRIAELAHAEQPGHPLGRRDLPWHTLRLQVSVLLEETMVEVLETRRIVAHRPGLSEIDNSVTVTPPPNWNGSLDPGDLGIDVVRGGVLHSPQLQAPNRLGFGLRLAHPLGAGEEYEFFLRMKVTRPFAPHFLCTPIYPCDRFDLAIRFPPGQVPARVWLLDNVFPLELTDPWPERTPVELDMAGEARAEFTDLEPHRSYGLGWEPRSQD
jgi:hypothetical protein